MRRQKSGTFFPDHGQWETPFPTSDHRRPDRHTTGNGACLATQHEPQRLFDAVHRAKRHTLRRLWLSYTTLLVLWLLVMMVVE